MTHLRIHYNSEELKVIWKLNLENNDTRLPNPEVNQRIRAIYWVIVDLIN